MLVKVDTLKTLSGFCRKLSNGACQHTSPSSVRCTHDEGLLYPAVEEGLLDLFKLLYRSGGTTNAQLTILSQSPKYQAIDEQTYKKDPRRVEVNEYLQQAARHPRRLRDMCVFAVSHLLGSRADRKDRMAALPNPIKDELLFKHVIQDFHTDDDATDKKDPPGLYYCTL